MLVYKFGRIIKQKKSDGEEKCVPGGTAYSAKFGSAEIEVHIGPGWAIHGAKICILY
jgi:hypothetical protein